MAQNSQKATKEINALITKTKLLLTKITETNQNAQEKMTKLEEKNNESFKEIKKIASQIDQKEQETMTELDKLISEQIKNLTDQE